MALQNDNILGIGSGNTYIDSLLWGCGWFGGPIYISLGTGQNAEGLFGYDWLDVEIEAIARALVAYESVCNLNFVVTSVQAADMVLWSVDGEDLGFEVQGSFDVPDQTFVQNYGYVSRPA